MPTSSAKHPAAAAAAHHEAAAHHQLAAHHSIQAAHHHSTGDHEAARKHAAAAHEHSGHAATSAKAAHGLSQKARGRGCLPLHQAA